MHGGNWAPITPEIVCTVILLFLSEYTIVIIERLLVGWMWICGDWKLCVHLVQYLKYLTRTTRTDLNRIFISFLRLNNWKTLGRKKWKYSFSLLFKMCCPGCSPPPFQLCNNLFWTNIDDSVTFSWLNRAKSRDANALLSNVKVRLIDFAPAYGSLSETSGDSSGIEVFP